MIIKIDNDLAVNPNKVVYVIKCDRGVNILVELGKSYTSLYTDVSYKKVIALLNGEKI